MDGRPIEESHKSEGQMSIANQIIAQTLQQADEGLPDDQIVETVAGIIHAEFIAGRSVEVAGNSVHPPDEDGNIWGTNPYGQDFPIVLNAQEATLNYRLQNFVFQVVLGDKFGLYPPEG